MKSPKKLGYLLAPVLIGLVSMSLIPMCWSSPDAPGCVHLGDQLYPFSIASGVIMAAVAGFICWITYNEDKARMNGYFWFFGRR